MTPNTLTENPERFLKKISLHRLLFIFFLFSFPFSIRKVLAIVSGDSLFNEYTDISIYLSDILLVATLAVFILENKLLILSIVYWRRMFHVEHLLLPIFIPLFFIFWSGLSIFWSESTNLSLMAYIKLLEGYFLYLYILISNVPRGTLEPKTTECSTWNIQQLHKRSDSQMFHVEHSTVENRQQSLLNVPRGTFSSFLYYLIYKCSTWNIWQIILSIFVISAIFQSVIAIFQFISQKSLGLTFLGESIFSLSDPGVAKVVINGHIFLRSYGLFPHPNVLGGFIALSLLITIAYPLFFNLKMFHVEHWNQKPQNVPRGTFTSSVRDLIAKCSTWNIQKRGTFNNFRKMFHVEHLRNIWLYRAILFMQLLALSFSFSKSAIIAYFIGFIWLISGIRKMFHVEHWNQKPQNVPRGTFTSSIRDLIAKCSTWNIGTKNHRMFHVEHLIIIAGVVLLGILSTSLNLRLFLTQPFMERLFYMEALKGLFEAYFFQGLGMGQFVFTMQQFFDEKLLPWQLQPIHNVFLLIFSEVGIIGLVLFLWFFISVFLRNSSNVPRGTLEPKTTECSTWNIHQLRKRSDSQMFHVEHSSGTWQNDQDHKKEVMESTNVPRGTILKYLLRSLLIAVTIIMLVDHYFWDIQQGQLLLWIILGLAVAQKRY